MLFQYWTYPIIGKRCCEKDLKATKKLESLADNNNECEQNKGITTFLSGNKNLFRRDANGQFRRTFFFVTPKISNRAETTVFAASAAHIARKENCAKITNHVIKDLNFHRLEAGIWFPSSSDFAALRRTESQRLANLSGNSFLNKSDIFQDKLRKIKNKTDWYLQSWPTPSQVEEKHFVWDMHMMFLMIITEIFEAYGVSKFLFLSSKTSYAYSKRNIFLPSIFTICAMSLNHLPRSLNIQSMYFN